MAADSVLQQVPSAEIVILGDFNAHHAEWLGSRSTDHAGRSVYDFALAYGLTQLVASPTRIPDTSPLDDIHVQNCNKAKLKLIKLYNCE
ncbi:unnamed protein product [Parnassius mnemosyne]|uniref:Endonuclease/exonuclease/phosphatase domain-containing protein n=1 Tax=Parnassius mnemosyne TaxID=213953 RepID=A0AAV1L602_9NEOP